MEDVLDLYHEEYDRERPVVCFDESSKQLLGDVRPPIEAAPGRVERYDTEYQRNGTRNLFMFCEPKGGWRHIEVTGRRTAVDFAQQMKWLVDEAYPDATVVRVVLDNLNTHRPGVKGGGNRTTGVSMSSVRAVGVLPPWWPATPGPSRPVLPGSGYRHDHSCHLGLEGCKPNVDRRLLDTLTASVRVSPHGQAWSSSTIQSVWRMAATRSKIPCHWASMMGLIWLSMSSRLSWNHSLWRRSTRSR